MPIHTSLPPPPHPKKYRVYLVQCLEALQALHALRILHRDVKPANILLDEEGNAKLGDLNVSKCVDDETGEVQSVMGTLPYMAPEIWEGKPYGFAADLYSLGCTLFELTTLSPPFDGATPLHIRRAVLKRQFQATMDEALYSQDLRDVILTRLLHADPEQRQTAEALLQLPQVRQTHVGCVLKSVPPPHSDPPTYKPHPQQVASRLYLVKHKLPSDLPASLPLSPSTLLLEQAEGEEERASLTIENLPALLPSLLPGPSYPPPPSPPLTPSSEPPIPPPSTESSNSSTSDPGPKLSLPPSLQIGVVVRQESLTTLLRSPYPENMPPEPTAEEAQRRPASLSPSPASPHPPPPSLSPPQQQQPRKHKNSKLGKKARPSELLATTASLLGTLNLSQTTVQWEALPTPTSFPMPLLSPSPASPPFVTGQVLGQKEGGNGEEIGHEEEEEDEAEGQEEAVDQVDAAAVVGGVVETRT